MPLLIRKAKAKLKEVEQMKTWRAGLTKDSMMTPCPGILICSAQCACVEVPALIVYGPVFRSLGDRYLQV